MEQTKKQPKTKKSRSYSINDIYNWKFDDAMLPQAWADHLGEIPTRVTIYVDGEGGDGKTEYAIQMAKVFGNHLGKVRMINVELKKHKQIMLSWKRNRMKEEVVPNKNLQYEIITEFEGIKARLKRPNSGKYVIIDSISFFPLNAKEIQELFAMFPHKSFILLAYRADFAKNKPIRHLCDIKVNVNDHIAHVESSRFGGFKDYDVWPNKPTRKKVVKPQPTLFEGKEVTNG
jgi:hypothetical protein